MELLLSLCLGLALSAACGFRVFVPLLVMSLASLSGHLTLAPGFEWIGTWPALTAFAVATGLEILAFYIPWVDNLLDTVATPAAVVAGIVVAAAVFTGMSPFLRWTLAVIAGGGGAGLVQTATVVTRAASSISTGGLANPAVATVEAGGSLLTSVLAVVWPLLGVVLVAAVLVLLLRLRKARLRAMPASA